MSTFACAVITHRSTAIVVLLATAVTAAGLIYFLAPAEMPGTPEPALSMQDRAGGGEAGAAGEPVVEVETAEGESEWRMESVESEIGAGSGDLTSGDARAREDYLNAQFRTVAKLGVPAALAQVRQLPDADSKDMAMLALLGEWSGLSVTELARRGDVGRFGVAGALGLYLMNEGKMTPQETAALANEFLSDSQRVGVLARAAEKLAATDPTTALAMGEGLADWQQVRFLSRFVSGWASASPEAARAWAAQMPDQRTRSALLGRVLAEEAKTNPAAAAQTFAQAPPEDLQIRQRTARQIGAGWGDQDTLSAMQWADSLPTDEDRRAAYQGIRSVAPVGIGARISRGEDGLPILQDLVPGSPASNSGQLRSGDRVVAVADGNGTWVNSRSMPLGDVVRMIQGEPQTQVSLQVQSTDGSPPRVVTLGREQIIHRPGS